MKCHSVCSLLADIFQRRRSRKICPFARCYYGNYCISYSVARLDGVANANKLEVPKYTVPKLILTCCRASSGNYDFCQSERHTELLTDWYIPSLLSWSLSCVYFEVDELSLELWNRSIVICLKMGFISWEIANQFCVEGNVEFNQQSLKVVCLT